MTGVLSYSSLASTNAVSTSAAPWGRRHAARCFVLIGVLSALLCPNWLFVVSKLGLGPGAIDNTAVGNYVKAAINAFGFSRVCFEGVLGSGLIFGPIDILLQPPTPPHAP